MWENGKVEKWKSGGLLSPVSGTAKAWENAGAGRTLASFQSIKRQ